MQKQDQKRRKEIKDNKNSMQKTKETDVPETSELNTNPMNSEKHVDDTKRTQSTKTAANIKVHTAFLHIIFDYALAMLDCFIL